MPGGGALETFVVNHGYGYPHLYVVEAGVDYARFDRFHVNVAEDGGSIDEIFQRVSEDRGTSTVSAIVSAIANLQL